jgi:glucokinase
MKKKIISLDLGATKCAAAVVEHDASDNILHCKQQYSTKIATCKSLDELILKLEQGLQTSFTDSDAVCVGAAGHYDGQKLCLESGSPYPYSMPFAHLAKTNKWPNFAVIHDYAPVVCATFTSYMNDLTNIIHLNKSPICSFGRRVVLGVGTGLGLKDGILFADGDFWLGQNEMGHIGITMPPQADSYHQKCHDELLRFLRTENVLKVNEPLTFEKILAGQGMVRLHQFFYPSEKDLTPEEVGEKISHGGVNEVLALFAWYLGLFVGTVQLSFMPEGGVWITGGVILNHLSLFEYPEFSAGIQASPGYLSFRDELPLGVLANNEHAFMGGAYYATKRLV